MKRIFFIASIIFLSVVVVSAKKLPSKAAKLPKHFKQEIVKEIDYPQFAEDKQIEGDVWLKVCIDKEYKVKIIDLSATNQELGDYVREQLSDLLIENPGSNFENEYYLKVKFNILSR